MRGLIVVAMTSLAVGCSGASDVGSQDQGTPIAVAKVLNHPFSAQDGDATVHVRGGSELRLSGKDSKGRGVPVLTWTWSAANAAAESVPLVSRNENTVNLTVPGAAGELQFRLTVADGNGATDELSGHSPAASALYLKPHGELDHGGRALDLTGDPVLRAPVLPGILQWIEQGAHDTERVGASGCP